MLPTRHLQGMGKGFQNEGKAGVAVLIPEGVFRLTQAIEILQSNVVLRGSGVSGCRSCCCWRVGMQRSLAVGDAATDAAGVQPQPCTPCP